MKKLALLLGTLMVLSMALAACGGSGGGSSNGSTTLNVTMTDFAYNPNTWVVPANTKITLNLTNNGTVDHTWVLMDQPVTPPFSDSNKSNVLFSSGNVAAGKTATLSFTSPSTSGTYEVVCDLPGHLEAGMDGTLTVK